jgi:hypothetical protein
VVNSPQYRQAKTIVDRCLGKEGGLVALSSHKARKAFFICVVPPGHLPAFKTCWGAIPVSLAVNNRPAYMVKVYTCAEKNR